MAAERDAVEATGMASAALLADEYDRIGLVPIQRQKLTDLVVIGAGTGRISGDEQWQVRDPWRQVELGEAAAHHDIGEPRSQLFAVSRGVSSDAEVLRPHQELDTLALSEGGAVPGRCHSPSGS